MVPRRTLWPPAVTTSPEPSVPAVRSPAALRVSTLPALTACAVIAPPLLLIETLPGALASPTERSPLAARLRSPEPAAALPVESVVPAVRLIDAAVRSPVVIDPVLATVSALPAVSAPVFADAAA